MSRVLEQVDTTLGLVLAGEVQVEGKIIEIFGEIHNMIPPAPNFFTSVLESKALKPKDIVVLSEHATVMCYLKDDQHHLVQQVQGSDFIFFQMMLEAKKNKRNKKPICIDNRIESGLLSAIEEQTFMKYLAQSRNEGIYNIPQLVGIFSQCLKCVRNARNLQGEFEGIYENQFQRNMLAIERQLKITAYSLELGKEFLEASGTLMPDIQNGFVVCTSLYLAVQNIKIIGSLLVDINIIKTALSQPVGKRVVVFTGFAHAYRLLTVLQNAEITFEAENARQLIPKVKIFPEETVSEEKAMLEALSKLVSES